MNDGNWALRLAAAIGEGLRAEPGVVNVHSIRHTSPEEVEIVYSPVGDERLRGFRLGLAFFRSTPQRIQEMSVDQLAAYIVHTAILEPRSDDDFLPPDASGVRWLKLPEWVEELPR